MNFILSKVYLLFLICVYLFLATNWVISGSDQNVSVLCMQGLCKLARRQCGYISTDIEVRHYCGIRLFPEWV